ncbi:MAG: nitroreductase [Flavobacteriales bacterium]|nr:nitroreductase [Flavobacteriales bacterium]
MRYSVSELSDLIRDRRTIQPKDFTDRPVLRDVVERILSNGTWAPNHGMTQPWRFQVFMGNSRSRLADHLAATYRAITPTDMFLASKCDKLRQRPLQSTVVVAIGMERDPKGKISELDEICAVACAVQNMHLTCTAYGLGGFWSTGPVLSSDAMRDFLGLGVEGRCLGLFYIGYPRVEWPKGYRKPLPDVTTWHED